MPAESNALAQPARAQDLYEDLSPKQIDLIRATYQMIGEKGVVRLTLQDVADAAGVSKGVVPYYFKTKDNLILTTMRWVLATVAGRIEAAMERAETPEQKIDAMVNVIFVEPRANRMFYLAYLDLIDHTARKHQLMNFSASFQTVVNDLYSDVVRAGIRERAFRVSDVEGTAAVIHAIIDGLFLQWLQKKEWRRLHRTYKALCLKALRTYLYTER